MGRKGKYEEWISEDGLLVIEGWARDGLTDAQIAHNIGITTTTFYDWKKKFPAFSDALKSGKEVVDVMVENALLKRALGFTYDEITKSTKRVPIIGKNGEVTEIEEVTNKTVKKMVVPDTTAQIFWLKNRRPDKWRDKQDQLIMTIEDLTPLAEMLND